MTLRSASLRTLLSIVLFLAATVAAPPRARADNVSVGALTADGLTVRDLSCELESGGMLAVLQVVATLAKQKRTLDGCAASGGAFRVRWDWANGKATRTEVVRASPPSRSACIAGALKLTRSDLAGRCEAVVLVGAPEAAAKAADQIAADAPKK